MRKVQKKDKIPKSNKKKIQTQNAVYFSFLKIKMAKKNL